MAITFMLNDEAVNDQTSLLQTGDNIDDPFTDTDVAYSSLPAAFRTYLETTLGLSSTFPTDVGVATKTNSVTVDATGGSSLTSITFTDSAGGALTGDPATDDSGLDTVDGKSILLVADGDDTVIGKYDSDGNGSLDAIAFVIFKEDNVNATDTQAQVTFHIVTYTPIFHDDDTDPDDAVDLGNSLKLAASERLELDFADLPSGQNLFGTIAVDKTDLSKGGLLLFPKGALLNAAGTFTNASPTTNTSQGGGAVTIGNTNQMFDPGEGHFFIYVDDPVAASVAGVGLNQNNADDADTIGFSGTLPQTTAQVEIVQVQGNDPASIKITAYDFTFGSAVDTNAEARDLVTDPLAVNGTALAPTSATEVNITEVRVLDENGDEVTTGITINLTGNTAVVTGLQDNYTVEWTAPGHDGVLIEGVAGKYDLGGFNIVSANAFSEFVGQQIVIEDDGPAVSANETALLDDDALTGGNPGGTGDDVDSANTSGTLGHSFGTDGAGSIAFLTTGAPTGFTYELSGSNLLIKQGTTTVVTVTLNTATGAYTVTQNAPILHAAGLDENNQEFTLTYRVTDKDSDTADGTLVINVDDDTPTTSANATVLLDDDALTGGNAGGTDDDVDSANTSGTLGNSFGADGAGSIAFLTDGAPTGFTYELSGSNLLIKQGTTTVVTVTLNTATGAYAVTQNAPILHAAGLDENNQEFTLTYRVTDKDSDTADGTLVINVDDDTPTTSANATVLLDDDALTGGNAGGTDDDVDSANTSGTLGNSFGADGAGSIAFLTDGAPTGFTYELSGSNLLIKQGTTTVVTVTLNTATGAYAVTQNAPILHAAGLDENNQEFTLTYRVTDKDSDTADGTLVINVDDDTPTTSANATVLLDDDALTGGNAGGTDDDVDSANTSGTLGNSFGADGAGSIAFLTDGAPTGFTYELSGSNLLIKQGTTTVVTVTLNTATGAYAVTQNAPILHAAGLDENNQEFTLTYRVTDKDSDTADGTLLINVDDDTPTIGPIANGLVDFTTINGANLNDFGGTSTSSVTNSLNGSVGADQNDANNESSDGTKTYTFASATIASSSIAGLTSDISDDGTTARFFTDGATGTADQFDPGIDTLYFSNVLGQAGAGTYTFTVHQNPAPAFVELDFADLPSGQNLFGTIAVDKTDLSDGGLLLFPKGALLKADGTFTNTSPTTNTSQGGGAVTIGNTNQMFDPGEGHFFIYVDDPVAASVAGVGLDQNNADDADTIGFSGTLPQTTAQVEIVQVQGNDPASIKITAYDFTFGSAVNTNAEARDLVTDPLAVNGTVSAPTSATEVNITEVKVFDENGDQVTTGITINLDGNTAVVTGLQDDYTVQWTAPGHDGVLIEGVAGKYDLGGFNLVVAQPTPDQQFDFTVNVTDFDNDVVTSNEFSVGVDGTGLGVNDNDAVVFV